MAQSNATDHAFASPLASYEAVPSDATTPSFGHVEVLALIDEVERSLGRLRAQAGDDSARAREAEHLAAEVRVLEDERASLLERHLRLESQLAESRSAVTDAERRAEQAADECARLDASARAARISLESELAIAFELQAKEKEHEIHALREVIPQLERERDEAREGLTVAAGKLTAVVRLAEQHATRVQELEARIEGHLAAQLAAESALAAQFAAAAAAEEPSGSEASVSNTAIDEIEIARAAEARIQHLVGPKLLQLAQAAAFLRTRKDRLAALRKGLRHRARALRALRQIHAIPMPRMLSDTVAENTTVLSVGIGERAEIARERQELIELRALLTSSEESLARRAERSRTLGFAVFTAIGLSVCAALSWHVAGVLAPEKVLTTVELQVTSRAPEARQSGEVSGAGVADWVRTTIASDGFASAVAARLSERGRTHTESSALVADLGSRLSVESSADTIRLSLTGNGIDRSTATLDAVATGIVTDANRLSERRSDLLKVGIANARQEVGRTVFSHAETLADPSRMMRAAAIFGGFLALAALATSVLWMLARRSARAELS